MRKRLNRIGNWILDNLLFGMFITVITIDICLLLSYSKVYGNGPTYPAQVSKDGTMIHLSLDTVVTKIDPLIWQKEEKSVYLDSIYVPCEKCHHINKQYLILRYK